MQTSKYGLRVGQTRAAARVRARGRVNFRTLVVLRPDGSEAPPPTLPACVEIAAARALAARLSGGGR